MFTAQYAGRRLQTSETEFVTYSYDTSMVIHNNDGDVDGTAAEQHDDVVSRVCEFVEGLEQVFSRVASLLRIAAITQEMHVPLLITVSFGQPLSELLFRNNNNSSSSSSGEDADGIPLWERLGWMRPVMDAVDHLHHNNILHLNISLECIYVDVRTGVAKLGDYWNPPYAMKNSVQDGGEWTIMDGLPRVPPNPSTSAPEFLLHGKVTPGCDLYSLGIAMYQIITQSRVRFTQREREETPEITPVWPSITTQLYSPLVRFTQQCWLPVEKRASLASLRQHITWHQVNSALGCQEATTIWCDLAKQNSKNAPELAVPFDALRSRLREVFQLNRTPEQPFVMKMLAVLFIKPHNELMLKNLLEEETPGGDIYRNLARQGSLQQIMAAQPGGGFHHYHERQRAAIVDLGYFAKSLSFLPPFVPECDWALQALSQVRHRWWWGDIDATVATRLLMQSKQHHFLIRWSSQAPHYTLSVRTSTRVAHRRLLRAGDPRKPSEEQLLAAWLCQRKRVPPPITRMIVRLVGPYSFRSANEVILETGIGPIPRASRFDSIETLVLVLELKLRIKPLTKGRPYACCEQTEAGLFEADV